MKVIIFFLNHAEKNIKQPKNYAMILPFAFLKKYQQKSI